MVQQGGSADDIRLNIVIETFAQLQKLEQTRVNIDRLGQSLVQQRNALGQYASGWTNKIDPALTATGQKLNRILQEGFGPRFIGSIQGLNQAFIRTGQSLKAYAQEGLKAGAVSQSTAAGLRFMGQEMTAMGITGQMSSQNIAMLREQAASLQPTLLADAEAVAALRNQLDTLGTQSMVVAEQQMARFNRELTSTQKAGQGMLLSFALTQGAAGNLSQAMFGLGFAVIFTGTKFLNLITVLTAVGLATSAIALDKLMEHFKGAPPLIERVSERMEEFREALAEAEGEQELLRREMEAFVRSGESMSALIQKITRDIEDLGDVVYIEMGQFSEKLQGAAREALRLATAGEDIRAAFEGLSDIEIKWLKDFAAGWDLDIAQANIKALNTVAREELQEFEQQLEDARRLKVVLQPFEIQSARIDEQLDTITNAWDTAIEHWTDAAREGAEDQIDARRDQLQQEIDEIREGGRTATEAVRDALDEQLRIRRDILDEELDLIRDKAEDQVDIIRDSLKKQRDEIKDKLQDRIKIIRDRADDEIDVEKDRIKELKSIERELGSVLSDLQGEREAIRAGILGAEAELAALEAAAAQQGVAATEEKAIIRARIEGLEAEGQAIDESIRDRERERGGIQNQIDTIGELIEAIEDARDDAIEAARDEADARVDAAEDAADKIIDAINDTRDRSIKAARSRADEDIRQAQKAAEGQIRGVNSYTTASTRAAQKRAEADIEAVEDARDAAIEGYSDARDAVVDYFETAAEKAQIFIDKQKESVELEHDRLIMLRDDILPLMKEIVKQQIAAGVLSIPGAITNPTLREHIKKTWIRNALLDLGIPLEEIKTMGYQLGTRAIPGATGQPQLAVVHGGEEIRTPGQQKALPSGDRAIIFQIENFHVGKPSDMSKLERMLSKQTGAQIKLTTRSRRFMGR